MFTDVPDGVLTLLGAKSGHGVRVEFSGFPYIGVWSAANDAPFVALEPWSGHTTAHDEDNNVRAQSRHDAAGPRRKPTSARSASRCSSLSPLQGSIRCLYKRLTSIIPISILYRAHRAAAPRVQRRTTLPITSPRRLSLPQGAATAKELSPQRRSRFRRSHLRFPGPQISRYIDSCCVSFFVKLAKIPYKTVMQLKTNPHRASEYGGDISRLTHTVALR